jgi:hypothetical protein
MAMKGLRGKALAEYKQRLTLQPEQHHLVIGLMLGDGNLRFPGRSRQANLTVEHGDDQQEYVWYKYERFREWVLTLPSRVLRIYHKDRSRTLGSWRFSTISHPTFTAYHHLFSRDGRKIVPENISDLVEHPLSLAVWLMDDGNKNKDVLFLSTESFTVQEQERLRSCLRERFGIDSTLNFHSHSNGQDLFRIRLSREGSKRAVKLIAPFVLASLSYKFSAVPL